MPETNQMLRIIARFTRDLVHEGYAAPLRTHIFFVSPAIPLPRGYQPPPTIDYDMKLPPDAQLNMRLHYLRSLHRK